MGQEPTQNDGSTTEDQARLIDDVRKQVEGYRDAGTATYAPPHEPPPDRIGPYRILERLGAGGMGEVYLAEQTEPVRRRVALKLIKLGMDTRQVVARFESERQALALMNHPNIAAVLDAGAGPTGRPFFVMEHVPGEPITTYCDRHKLPVRGRLDLFIQVCNAVQHAHQKAIIHRDIKPSNVLVMVQDGKPVPKVIDFGVAKATNQKLTEQTVFTEQGQLIGTPEYMSPEQAEMTALDIDTRTDIYSLGVLLYELLTGTLPFDPRTLRSRGYAEIRRMIREVEPPKPSTRLSSMALAPSPPRGEGWGEAREPAPRGASPSPAPGEGRGEGPQLALTEVAARRQTDPRSLIKHVRGDLDWIVMKCLEKDRTRRYDTANGLALEIGRYLRNEPVLAGPPSARYRLGKFLKRYRGPVAATLALFVTLAAGLVATAGLYLRAESAKQREEQQRQLAEGERNRAVAAEEQQSRERQRADEERAKAESESEKAKKERDKAEKIAEFMSQTLAGAGPYVALGRDTTMLREMMDAAAKRIKDGELKDAPEAELRLRLTIGSTYRDLAVYDAAQELIGSTVELARAIHGDQHAEVAESLSASAQLLEDRGQAPAALPEYEAALAMRQRLFPGNHPDVAASLNNLANCLHSLGRPAEAVPKYEAALEMRQRLFAGDHLDVAQGLNNLAEGMNSLGRPAEALPRLEASLAMYQRLFAGDHPDVARLLNNVALCLRSLGRSAEALPKFEAGLAMWQRLFAGDHPDVARGFNNVALCLQSLGRPAEALPKFEMALETKQRLFAGDHPDVAVGLNNVAYCLQALGRSAEALPKFEAALEMVQRLFPGDHPHVAGVLNTVAGCSQSLGRPAEALLKYEAALEMRQRLFAGDHPDVAWGLNDVGLCLNSLGRSAEALPKYEAALAMRQRILPPDHMHIRISEVGLGAVLVDLKRWDEAEPLLLDSYAALAGRLDAPAKHKQRALEALVKLYEIRQAAEPDKGHDAKAAEWRAKLAEWQASTLPASSQPSSQPAQP